jgi:hypothetical protein
MFYGLKVQKQNNNLYFIQFFNLFLFILINFKKFLMKKINISNNVIINIY